MTPPVWHEGTLDDLPDTGDAPLLWYVRLDGPLAEAMAARAPLRDVDIHDLANRSNAAMRAMRRRLTKALIARIADCHPDTISIERTPLGVITVKQPIGWHLSVAGAWPHCLIGVARIPIGVDIEPYDAEPPPVDALTVAETAQGLSSGERLRRWLMKEAHAKRLGIASIVEGADIATVFEDGRYFAQSDGHRSECVVHVFANVVAAAALGASTVEQSMDA